MKMSLNIPQQIEQSSFHSVERHEPESYDSDETLVDGYISGNDDKEDAYPNGLCYKDDGLLTPKTGFYAKDVEHLSLPTYDEASPDTISVGLNFPCSNVTTDINKEKEMIVTLEKAYLRHDTDETAKEEAVRDKTVPQTSTLTPSYFEELHISDLLKSPGGSELTLLTEMEIEHYLSCINTATEDSNAASELMAAINLLETEACTDHWPEGPEVDKANPAVLGKLDEAFIEINSLLWDHNCKSSQEVSENLKSDNNAQKYLESVPEEEKRNAVGQAPCTESKNFNSEIKGEKSLWTHIPSDYARKIPTHSEEDMQTMDARPEKSNLHDSTKTNDNTLPRKGRICYPISSRKGQIMSKSRISTGHRIFNKTSRNIHKRNHMGETQLHKSAQKGDLASVKILLKAGINVNQKDNAGWTAIHEASCKGFTDIILELLHAGADVNSKATGGILPIHDAVVGNHYKAAKILLDFGADPFEKDENHKNAFDKSCNTRMTKLLTSYSLKLQNSFQEMISDEDNIQHKANANASSVTSPTRENCAKQQSVLDTLEDTKNRQRKLLLKESMTPLDAEEMCLIQDILNDVVTMQKDERDILAKKYRASVDSFKQGILTEKVTNLAGRQKILQQVVCQQKEVDQKITAHKQSKKSVVYRSEESSFLHSCNLSPGRNQIPAVCSVSAGLKANIANGSSMTTVVPALSGSPDLENSTVQDIFMRFAGNPEISDAGGNPANVFTAERRTENCISKLALKEKPAFLGLEYSSSNHNTAHPKNEQHLDFTNTVCMSPNPGPLTSTGRTVVQNNDPPSVRDSYQMPHAGQHSKIYYTDMVSEQKENTSVSSVDNLTSIGKLHQRMIDKAPTNHIASIQNNPSQRSENLSAASSHARGASKGRIRKIHLKKLINAGTLKPGENVLEFKIQKYSHKASLLADGRIKDCTGMIYCDLTLWVKSILGISISWQHAISKVTYCEKELKSFIFLKDLTTKEFLHPPSNCQAVALPSVIPTSQKESLQVFGLKDILIFDNKEFLPCHIMDQYWKHFIFSDSLDI